jgi:hypothetical protein
VTSCTSTSNSTRRATCETWDLPCNWAPFLESYQTTEKTISWNRKGQNKYIHTRDVHHKRRKTRKPPQFCSTQLGSLLSLHDTVKHVKILLEKDCRRNQKKLFIPSFTLFISSPGVSYFTPRPAKRYICSTLHHVKGHFAARNPQQQQQENRKCKTPAWQERKEGRRENAALRRTRQGKLTYIAGTEKEGREKTEPSKPGRQVGTGQQQKDAGLGTYALMLQASSSPCFPRHLSSSITRAKRPMHGSDFLPLNNLTALLFILLLRRSLHLLHALDSEAADISLVLRFQTAFSPEHLCAADAVGRRSCVRVSAIDLLSQRSVAETVADASSRAISALHAAAAAHEFAELVFLVVVFAAAFAGDGFGR